MNVLPLMAQSTQRWLVIGILVFLFIAMLVSVGIFAYSLWKQRKYNSTTLPSLVVETEEEDEGDAPGSAFALADLEEPISKNAYATRLDDYSLEDLPELPKVRYEPEEFTLPALEPSPPATVEVQQEVEEHEPLPPHEESTYEAPLVEKPALPVAETTLYDEAPPLYDEVPMEQSYEEPAAEVTPEPPPLDSEPEEPLRVEYSSFRDGDWKLPEGVAPAPAEPLPAVDQTFPSFNEDSEQPPSEVSSEAEAPVSAPASEPKRRGFRKLRMPVDKIDGEVEEVSPESESATDASYEGRRRMNVPTDS